MHLTWPFAAPFQEREKDPQVGYPARQGCPRCPAAAWLPMASAAARRLHLAVFTLRLYFRLRCVYLGEMYFTNYYVSALLRALCNEIKALPECRSSWRGAELRTGQETD